MHGKRFSHQRHAIDAAMAAFAADSLGDVNRVIKLKDKLTQQVGQVLTKVI